MLGTSGSCALRRAPVVAMALSAPDWIWGRAAGTVSKYVGGVYFHRDRVGDPGGRIKFANSALQRTFGYEGAIGEVRWNEITPAAFAEADRGAIQELLETGYQKRPNEYLVRRKDGSTVWMETKGALIYRDGKPFAFLFFQ